MSSARLGRSRQLGPTTAWTTIGLGHVCEPHVLPACPKRIRAIPTCSAVRRMEAGSSPGSTAVVHRMGGPRSGDGGIEGGTRERLDTTSVTGVTATAASSDATDRTASTDRTATSGIAEWCDRGRQVRRGFACTDVCDSRPPSPFARPAGLRSDLDDLECWMSGRHLIVIAVLGHDGQTVFDSGCCDQRVDEFHGSLDSGGSAVGDETSPAAHHGLADRDRVG